MRPDLIIFITILIFFFVLLFLFVFYAPRILIKFRAKSFGINIDLNQAAVIKKCSCANRKFFNNVKAIWNLEHIPIEKLALHEVASGNLTNIKNGISELKAQNIPVDFSIISAIDLTRHDIKTEIRRSQELRTISVSNLTNNLLTIDYQITFSLGFPHSVWNEKTDETRKTQIKNKLEIFLKSWNEIDIIKTENFIRENILSMGYLEKEVGSLIENQSYAINKCR